MDRIVFNITEVIERVTFNITEQPDDVEIVVSEMGAPGYTPVKGVDYFDGEQGEDGIGFNFRGKWDDRTQFYINDVVSEPIGENLYIAVADSLNQQLFDTRYWAFFLPKGAKGDKGDTGGFSGNMDDIVDGSSYVKTENNFTDAAASKLSSLPTNPVISNEVSIIKKLTQAEYDGLNPKIDTTLYIII